MPTFRGIEDSTGHVYDVEDAYARTQASAASAAASEATSTAAEAASKAESAEQSVNALGSRVASLENEPRIVETGSSAGWVWRKYSDGRATCRWMSNESHQYRTSNSVAGFTYCEESLTLPFAMMKCAAFGSDQNTRYVFANITGGATGGELSTDLKAVWFRVGSATTVNTRRALIVEGYYE